MTKKLIILIVIIVLLAAGVLLFKKQMVKSPDKVITPAAQTGTSPTEIGGTLEEQQSSGVGGIVNIASNNNSGKLSVTISAVNSANTTASIMSGNCQNLGQEEYKLGNVDSNPKMFDLPATAEDLIGKLPLVLTLRDSSSKVLSCGDFRYENEEKEKAEQ